MVIVGGGIAGLSRRLAPAQARLPTTSSLLEMEPEAGGNARWGANEVTRLSRGPRTTCRCPASAAGLVRELFDGPRRLRRHDAGTSGTWCMRPTSGCSSTAAGRRGSSRSRSDAARPRPGRALRGADGGAARHRPLHAPDGRGTMSRGRRREDALSMAAWLDREGLDSPWLRWMVDYACRDDYGALAARRLGLGRHPLLRRAGRRRRRGPLTWPEGNGWIIAASAASGSSRRVRTGAVAYRVERREAQVARAHAASRLDGRRRDRRRPAARRVPHRRGRAARRVIVYSPWITANLTLDRWPRERGFPVGVGQRAVRLAGARVRGRDAPAAAQARAAHGVDLLLGARGRQPGGRAQWLLGQDWGSLKDRILDDLSRAHPDISDCVTRIDIMRLGHAMVRPTPGFLDSPIRQYLQGARPAVLRALRSQRAAAIRGSAVPRRRGCGRGPGSDRPRLD